ncbi:hypothetical protein FSARC_10476 [Fusarium sarcochroum]|uniref:Uncharacterized protein n=1 Tax=Fusarium sarcochroum TaxID=1208366 RepID=A0A8H4TM71_9HYPO|nr:hypothetical protein FSARC_10476 [Fusarium sarcochroum]
MPHPSVDLRSSQIKDTQTQYQHFHHAITHRIIMCFYGRVVFSCAHERWGLCVKQCQIAQDFRAEKAEHDCVLKRPHVPTSRKLQRKCNKCMAMEDKLVKAKKGIEDLKATLKRVEDEKNKTMESEEKGETMDGEQGLEVICEAVEEIQESERMRWN